METTDATAATPTATTNDAGAGAGAADGNSNDTPTITLRVSGLGHTITLENVSSTNTTVGQLKGMIETQTKIPAIYQRLISRGHKLDEDNDGITLHNIGMKDRTKIMLLHNKLYGIEKDGYEELMKLSQELDDLILKKKEEEKEEETGGEDGVIHELVTRICCKLDSVDIKGSEHLKQLRKSLIQKAEMI